MKKYDTPNWNEWVNCLITKKSGKPFKSGLKTGSTLELTTNPYSGKDGFKMDDGSIVDCHQCKLVEI